MGGWGWGRRLVRSEGGGGVRKLCGYGAVSAMGMSPRPIVGGCIELTSSEIEEFDGRAGGGWVGKPGVFGEKGAYVCRWAYVGWYCFLGEGWVPRDHWDYFLFVLEVVYDVFFGEVL